MNISASMPSSKQVILLFETSSQYGRGLLVGISEAVRSRFAWKLHHAEFDIYLIRLIGSSLASLMALAVAKPNQKAEKRKAERLKQSSEKEDHAK